MADEFVFDCYALDYLPAAIASQLTEARAQGRLVNRIAELEVERDELRRQRDAALALVREIADYLDKWQSHSLEPTYSTALIDSARALLGEAE